MQQENFLTIAFSFDSDSFRSFILKSNLIDCRLKIMTRWLLKSAVYLLVLLRRSDSPPPHGGQTLLDGNADSLLTG